MSVRTNAHVSPHGMLSIALAAAFLALGIARGELVALISGMTLTIANAFALITVIIARFRWNEFSAGIERTDSGSFRLVPLSTRNKRAWHTGFTAVRYRIILQAEETSSPVPFDFPLPEALSSCIPALPKRGRYTVLYSRCLVTDYAGFFSLPTKKTHDLSGRILAFPPARSPANKSKPPASPAGNSTGRSTFLRSEELYEIRQFRPGDDRRKINWKAFAHTGELLAREGELLPPPSTEYSVLFWATVQRAETGKAHASATDRFETLVARAYPVCLELLRSGKSLRFPNSADILIDPEDPHAADRLDDALSWPTLASASDRKLSETIAAIGSIDGSVVCFTLPAQAERTYGAGKSKEPDFPAAFLGMKDRIAFYVGPLASPPSKKPPLNRLKALLLENPEESKPRPAAARRHDGERLIARLQRNGYRAAEL